MAFRSKEAIGLMALALLAPAQELSYEVRHDHWRKFGAGTLVISERGVSFAEAAKPKHRWEWPYEQIQQLEITPHRVRVLTYRDSAWKLGADREYKFALAGSGSFEDAYRLLKDRLDQRLVAAVADEAVEALWEVPVKHLERFGGSDGALIAGRDRLVYKTDARGESRTWRYGDIENVSSSGPFQLSLTTYERARSHYGNLKGFNFQLKRALDEDRFNDLWRRVERAKGLQILALKEQSQ